MEYRQATAEDLRMAEKGIEAQQWPFRRMQVGEQIVFGVKHAKLAQKTAHTYGVKYGLKFATKKINQAGEMLIKRIA